MGGFVGHPTAVNLRLSKAAKGSAGANYLPSVRPHATAASVRIRTKLYTAAANVNIQPTRATPRCRTLRSSPTVLSQPKTSSTPLRFR